MLKIHFYGGYAGLLPFVLLVLAIILGVVQGVDTDAPVAVLLAYSGMIASFLGGTHWLPSLINGNSKQAALALAPSVVALVLFVLAFLITPSLSLFGMAIMFGVLYRADMVLLPESFAIAGYKKFRLNLSAIVGGLLLVAAIAVLF